MTCIPTQKTNASPTPFAATPGSNANALLCYKGKRFREADITLTVDDQLGGSGPMLVRTGSASRVVCVPATF